LAVLVVLLLAAGLLTRAVQRHRERLWVTKHVMVTPQPGAGAAFETRLLDGHDTDHVITVVPEVVGRSTTVEEDPS
jgi:hypothetical protein